MSLIILEMKMMEILVSMIIFPMDLILIILKPEIERKVTYHKRREIQKSLINLKMINTKVAVMTLLQLLKHLMMVYLNQIPKHLLERNIRMSRKFHSPVLT